MATQIPEHQRLFLKAPHPVGRICSVAELAIQSSTSAAHAQLRNRASLLGSKTSNQSPMPRTPALNLTPCPTKSQKHKMSQLETQNAPRLLEQWKPQLCLGLKVLSLRRTYGSRQTRTPQTVRPLICSGSRQARCPSLNLSRETQACHPKIPPDIVMLMKPHECHDPQALHFKPQTQKNGSPSAMTLGPLGTPKNRGETLRSITRSPRFVSRRTAMAPWAVCLGLQEACEDLGVLLLTVYPNMVT